MIWKIVKSLTTTICLSLTAIVLIASPFSLGALAFASLFAFLGCALWIDFTKPLAAQQLSPVQLNLLKLAVWGLIIIFVTMFIYSIFNGEAHLNGRGFSQLITALLKSL